MAGGESGVAELAAEVAHEGELGQVVVAFVELGFDRADVGGELAGEAFFLGTGGGGRAYGGAELLPEVIDLVVEGVAVVGRGRRRGAAEERFGQVEDSLAGEGQGEAARVVQLGGGEVDLGCVFGVAHGGEGTVDAAGEGVELRLEEEAQGFELLGGAFGAGALLGAFAFDGGDKGANGGEAGLEGGRGLPLPEADVLRVRRPPPR